MSVYLPQNMIHGLRRMSCQAAAILAVFGSVFSGLAAHAGESDVLAPAPEGRAMEGVMDIELYFGGFSVGALNLITRMDGNQYSMESDMGTRGLLDVFLNGFARLEARGEIENGVLKPSYYRAASGSGGKVERDAQVYFAEGTPARVEAVPSYAEDDRPYVPMEEQVGAVDPLSAALFSATFRDGDDVCAGTIKIFDGRRRYNLHLSYVGDEQLTARGKGRYEGPAMRCEAVFEQLKGFQEDGSGPRKRRAYDPATVWVARFPAPDGGADVLMPVKVVAETSWGNAVAHGRNIQIRKLDKNVETASAE